MKDQGAILLALALIAASGLGCEDSGTFEQAGEAMDEAVEDLRDGGRDALDEAKESLDEAVDKAKKKLD